MTEAKKSTKSSEVSIVLLGPSHNGQHGETRTTDAETAANLVAAGAARYSE